MSTVTGELRVAAGAGAGGCGDAGETDDGETFREGLTAAPVSGVAAELLLCTDTGLDAAAAPGAGCRFIGVAAGEDDDGMTAATFPFSPSTDIL